jgi:predicted transporter
MDVVVGLTGAFPFPVCLGGVVFGGMMMLTKSVNNDSSKMIRNK